MATDEDRRVRCATYLADSFQQANGKYCSKAADGRENGSKQCQQRRPEDADQHQQLAADPLR